MLKLSSAFVVLLVLVAGCGSDDSEVYPNSTTTSPPTVMKPRLPEPIKAEDAPVVQLKDVETKRVSLSSPDWLATTDGALWVRLDGGEVVKLDAATGAIRARIRPPQGDGLCQGFGTAGDDAIYSCAYAGVVARIDPLTDTVVSQLKSDFSTDQGHLALAGGKVWMLTPDGDKVVPIDPSDDSLGKTIDLGSYCVELSGSRSVLYAACTSDGLVIRVDVARREVTHRLALTDPRTISASPSGVFVSFDGGVAQLEPRSLEPVAVYDVTLGLRGGIYADPDRAWLRADGGPFLTVIDPVAHKILQTIIATDLPSGGNALRVGDVVWATASDAGTLVGLKAK